MPSICKSYFRGVLIASLLLFVSCAIRPIPQYANDPSLPQVSGVLSLSGLNGEVKVYRDEWGIPHIFTEDEHDLFFADGFVQAQDRLWEIVFFRAIATGRLCELFGNIGMPGQNVMGMGLSTLAIDKRMRIMGMKLVGEAGEALLGKKQPEILAQMQAFCDGINAYIEKNRDRLPIEFRVLYHEPELFRPADVISLSRFYGSNLCANLEDELLRHALVKRFGEDMAWKLMPLHDSVGPTIVPKEMLHNRLDSPRPLPAGGRPDPTLTGLSADAALALARTDKAIRTAALFPKNIASNNWVVSPKITATGTAMLANDPHLIHVQPSLCYIMHLKGAGYDAYGVVFPGQPYIVMGHTRKLSWGATVTGADVQDLFVETINPDNPGQYLYKGQWKDFVVHKEVIKIRPGKLQTGPDKRLREKVIEVRASIHGPIINDMVPDLPKDTPPLALRWVGYDFSRDPRVFETYIQCSTVEEFIHKMEQGEMGDIEMINAAMMFNRLMRGQSIDDFIAAMEVNELLNMNWVAADADGHIAYLPGGLVPIRKKGLGVLPVPGESGDYDWEGFIPLMEHPHAIDPERGWMATANNEVVDAEWYPYVFSTGYASGWRAWRIEELIEALKPITVDDMKRIQNDVYVKQAEVFVPLILDAVEQTGVTDKRVLKAAKLLSEWDYEATIDSPGPAIFYDTLKHLPDRVLKDDFKAKDYDELVKGHMSHVVQMWIVDGESEFFDDKGTKNKVEDVNDVLVGSLEDSVKWLTNVLGKDMEKWQWGQLHTIKWYHPMGFGPLKEMSIGPFPHPGGDNTVRNASAMGFGKRRHMAMGGPVMRHVMDMGDPDNAQLVIDGSQSGQWLSPHYRDMHTLWYNSRYKPSEKRPEKVAEQAESLLRLVPR